MKKNILYIVHQWLDTSNYDSTSIGGTTLHIFDIIKKIRNKHNCFILYHSNGKYALGIYTEKEEKIYDLNVAVKNTSFDNYDKEYSKLLSELIDKLDIDIVHIHHLMGHPYDIVKVLKNKKIKTIVTLHDFFLICPRVNMLYKNQDYCDLKDERLCNQCLEQSVKERNKIVKELFDYSKKIIVPNKTVGDIYKRIHPNVKYHVIEHGLNLPQKRIKYVRHKKLNVAFVGWLTYLKGGDIAKIVIENMSHKDFSFHFFGLSDDPYFGQNTKNYTYHGEYHRDNLADLLRKNKIDVVCLLTRCPETFCYTLSEVASAGIPIIGFKIGAIGERIDRLKIGWTVKLSDKEIGIINKLKEIQENSEEYKKCLSSFNKLNLPSTNEMIEKTLKEYSDSKKIRKKEWKINCLQELSFEINEIPIIRVKTSKKKKLYLYIKRHIPYSIKRPIYLLITKLKNKK